MKSIKKILSIIICVVLTASLLAGCGSSNERIDFIYPISGDIRSFDPQVAATGDELLIIENCFEGLVRITDTGEIRSGVAEGWDISSDGLTYTFNLRHGAKWRIKEDSAVEKLMGKDFNPDITAHDFVFALQRACDPITDSPLFSSIASIRGASEIHSGTAGMDALGVTAKDDYTLAITLKGADAGFMNTLTTAVAMPCNEAYFNATKGRYGLGLDYSMFNGQFYVSSVLESSYILRNNDLYVGEYKSAVTDITLSIADKDTDVAKRLESGYYDCAYITGDEYESLKSKKITAIPYSSRMWAMVLNKSSQIFSSKDLRQAVCLSISDISLDNHSYLTRATGITPPSCTIGGSPADKAIGETVYRQSTDKAIELWRKGLEEEKYTSASLTVITTEGMEDITKQLVQGIQGGIGSISSYGKSGKITFSLKIEVLSESDFDSAFANGDYDLAFCCFGADSDNALTYLSTISSGKIIGVDEAIAAAQTVSAGNLPNACRDIEEKILDDYSIVPILFESSYYAQAEGVSGVDFHPGSGRVSFVYATREN